MWSCFKTRESIIQSRIDELYDVYVDCVMVLKYETDQESIDILESHSDATMRAILRMIKMKCNKHETES